MSRTRLLGRLFRCGATRTGRCKNRGRGGGGDGVARPCILLVVCATMLAGLSFLSALAPYPPSLFFPLAIRRTFYADADSDSPLSSISLKLGRAARCLGAGRGGASVYIFLALPCPLCILRPPHHDLRARETSFLPLPRASPHLTPHTAPGFHSRNLDHSSLAPFYPCPSGGQGRFRHTTYTILFGGPSRRRLTHRHATFLDLYESSREGAELTRWCNVSCVVLRCVVRVSYVYVCTFFCILSPARTRTRTRTCLPRCTVSFMEFTL
ncbi:hypothetical protein C8Q77DRAFT_147328 [Trametes polyzona]|nr:hypothetical protein C8Q77DRAFT_147328 [Trametes polyzona]